MLYLYFALQLKNLALGACAEYFESKGCRRPDSDAVARRALEPPPPKTEAEGPKRVRRELLLSLLPDCVMLAIYMDSRNKKRREKEAAK